MLLKFTNKKVFKIFPITVFPKIIYHVDLLFYLNNSTTHHKKSLNNLDIQTVIYSSKTIRKIINNKNKNHIKSEAGVYSIACAGCYENYIGETSRSIKKMNL